MTKSAFYQMFLELIKDLYDAENQIVNALPLMIQNCSNAELKESLSNHLNETKEQVNRLRRVFSILNEQPTGKPCKGIQGLIEEGKEILQKNLTPAVKDAFIIVAAQKIEHYEIASYGSACTLADHLKAVYQEDVDFDEICDLLEDSLDEEAKADKKLTSVAEGKFFSKGVNDEAESELRARTR
jgi:ferritin-like metal-binding protein YciE